MKSWKTAGLSLFALLFLILFLQGQACAGQCTWKIKRPFAGPFHSSLDRLYPQIIFKGFTDAAEGSLQIKPHMEKETLAKNLVKKFDIGQLECVSLFSGETQLLCPETGILQLPFIFNSYDEVDYIRHHMSPDFDAVFASRGLVLLSWVHMDFDPVFSTKTGFELADDFRGRTFGSPYGWEEDRLLDQMGAAKVQCFVKNMHLEMQKGRFDSIIAPSIVIMDLKMFGKLKYVNPMPVHYSPAIIVVKAKTLGKLPEASQAAVLKSRLPLADQACEAIVTDNQKILDALVKYGLALGLTPPGQLASMKERSRPVYEEAAGKLFQRELLDELERNLEVYRAVKKD